MSNLQINPPIGDSKQAEKYISQLIDLITQDKLEISHTDLSQYDPSSLKDHYRADLRDYQVEISHSKNPETDEDSYVILFNNLKQIKEGTSQKTILAYMYLDQTQFERFKNTAESQIEKKKKAEEEKRLKEALSPIDEVLENLRQDKELELIPAEEPKEETKEVVNPDLVNVTPLEDTQTEAHWNT